MHVPVWHEKTKELRESGAVSMLGIVQEQHPDRARLFRQWKGLDWPILTDPLNLLEVPYVPITLLIDEHGIIRDVGGPGGGPGDKVEKFVAESFAAPPDLPAPGGRPDLDALREKAETGDPAALRELAGQTIAWGGTQGIDEAIDAYARVVEREPGDRWSRFRLGVAYRMRYDSGGRREGDFARAVGQWSRALEIDPNNYIFRRRIQQYGPRLDKPYPFYDWVPEAREEILARGETPVPLAVEPGGAEFASRIGSFPGDEGGNAEPDPEGKILRDEGFVDVETVVVPPMAEPGSSVRVHLILRPRPEKKAHWNNEVDDTVVWVSPPDGWEVDRHKLTAPRPEKVLSTEPRQVEFEAHCPEGAEPGTVKLDAYALYYVCEDVHGVCLYRRADVPVEVEVVRELP